MNAVSDDISLSDWNGRALPSSTMINRTVLMFCFVSTCLVLSGCGRKQDYPGARRYPLTGKVTVKGEPIGMGVISFLPQSDKGRVSGGEIKDGIYSIPEAKGPTAGMCRVEIRWSKYTGKQSPDPSDKTLMIDIIAEGLPPKYHKNSELTAEVGPDKTTFDFDLEPK